MPRFAHALRLAVARRLALAALLVLTAATAVPSDAQEASDAPEAADPNGGAGKGEATSPAFVPPSPPVGVRFGESLEDRRLRLGYSWERLWWHGTSSDTDSFSPGRARAVFGYASSPRSLEVTVHRFELAYSPHPRVTLVAELPFLQKELDRIDPTSSGACPAPAVHCQVQTEGVGDLGFAVIVPFIRKGFESSQVHFGLDVPTGAYRRGGDDMRLPYDSQIGNGTVDLEWGWTYKGELERIAWGGQAVGRHPVGRNGLNYREGSRFTGRLWVVGEPLRGWGISLRGEWEKQNEIEGFDRSLDKSLDLSNDPEKRDGITLSVAPGMSFEIPALNGQRIGVEAVFPVWQDLDGPQLERTWSVKTAWQWIY